MDRKPQPTKAQEAAISKLRNKTLLVSAAAGSGKTWTLTERVKKLLIDEGRKINEMLIVTFTRSAAADLKRKISEAISKAIAEHPERDDLHQQLVDLGNADICTIDSFFTAPVKANFDKLGLPSAIRLADSAELDPIRTRIMSEAIERRLSSYAQDGNITLDSMNQNPIGEIFSIIASSRDSSNIIPSFLRIYDSLVTSVRGIERLSDSADRMDDAAKKDFFESEEGKVIRVSISARLEHIISLWKKEIDNLYNFKKVGQYYISTFESDVNKLRDLKKKVETSDYKTARDHFASFKYDTITRVPKDIQDEDFIDYQERRKKLKNKVTTIKSELITDEPDKIASQFNKNAEYCRAIYSIFSDFEESYKAEKKKKGICEFSDMPKFMLELLLENGEPSEYCLSLRKKYKEVYIDEYQDVNEIQDKIFELIGGPNRFMVGDVKQSIYAFREADPELFSGYKDNFPLYDEKDLISLKSPTNTIFMSENFRCDQNVITFANTVCRKVFGVFPESIGGYSTDDDLVFAKKDPASNPRVVINLIDKDELANSENTVDIAIDEQESTEASKKEKLDQKTLSDEACVIANQIARLIYVEKYKPSEVAVLVRTHKHSKPLMLALDKLGIKYSSTKGSALFSRPDMLVLLDLLTVINNPLSDVHLCRLLTADVAGVSPVVSFDELVEIRKEADKAHSLYASLTSYGENGKNVELAARCRNFVNELKKMRRIASRLSAEKLLRQLTTNSRYSCLTETESFVYLFDCACNYVKRMWNGLGSFITYINKIADDGDSGTERPAKKEGHVCIMSMHQSKGLEFEACFLFGLANNFNFMDVSKPMIYNKKLGITLKHPPKTDDGDSVIEAIKQRYEDNHLWQAAKILTKGKQMEEEARILYVALTRARERLYLSASLKESFDELIDRINTCYDIDYEIKNADSFINLIMFTLAGLELDNDNFKVNVFKKGEQDLLDEEALEKMKQEKLEQENAQDDDSRSEEQKQLDEEEKLKELERLKKIKELEESLEDAMRDGIEFNESENILSLLPSKIAASKVSANLLEDLLKHQLPAQEDDSEQKYSDTVKAIEKRIELMQSQNLSFDSLRDTIHKASASEKGTATHLFLQFCDYDNVDKNGLDFEISRLVEGRFISAKSIDMIDRDQLENFFKSNLYQIIRSAKSVKREFRFGMLCPASDFTQNDKIKSVVSDKKIFVQGSIDLIIEDAHGELILCDYKTDKVTENERNDRAILISNMREKHGHQLKQYEYAIEQIFGRKPKKTLIYLTAIGEAIEL